MYRSCYQRQLRAAVTHFHFVTNNYRSWRFSQHEQSNSRTFQEMKYFVCAFVVALILGDYGVRIRQLPARNCLYIGETAQNILEILSVIAVTFVNV